MSEVCFGDVLYIKGRVGWQALGKDEYLSSGDYYLVTGVDITDLNRIDFSRCYYVTKERYDLDPNIQLKNGDIIVTKDGTIGKIGVIENLDRPATLNSHLFLIRNLRPDLLDNGFLFYILKSDYFQKFASNNSSGSNILGFTQANIQKFVVDLPSIMEQRQIASFVEDIDAKIRNNVAISTNLEAMAKLLYDYWFVQFDFPDKNGKPYKSSGGKMVWNDELKREIPAGWEVNMLEHYCSFENGDRGSNYPSRNDFISSGIPFVAGGAINENEIEYNEVRYISEEKYNSLRAGKANKGDILMTLRGSLAKCVYSPYDKMAIASALVIVRPNNGVSREYLHRVLISDYYIQLLKNYDNGSVQANLSVDTVKSFPMVFPETTIMNSFTNNIRIIEEKEAELREENQQMISLRDFLLPMLMNGQVKFGKA